jgi:hypothetical protein
MSRWISRTRLVEIVDGDDELVALLVSHGVIVEGAEGFEPEHVERVLVSRTLLRELDVNLEGIEIILRLRERLLATHIQIGALLEELRRARD